MLNHQNNGVHRVRVMRIQDHTFGSPEATAVRNVSGLHIECLLVTGQPQIPPTRLQLHHFGYIQG